MVRKRDCGFTDSKPSGSLTSMVEDLSSFLLLFGFELSDWKPSWKLTRRRRKICQSIEAFKELASAATVVIQAGIVKATGAFTIKATVDSLVGGLA